MDLKPSKSYDESELPGNNSMLQATPIEMKTPINSFELNPCMFAPTGDIYSYFQRRSMMPSSSVTFQYPLRYSAVQALSTSRNIVGT